MKEFITPGDYRFLQDKWNAAWINVGVLPPDSAWFIDLLNKWNSRKYGVKYHTLEHLVQCLSTNGTNPIRDLVLFYHDVHYSPVAEHGENEHKSWLYAKHVLNLQGVSEEIGKKVKLAIYATVDQLIPKDIDFETEDLIVDVLMADLSILSASTEHYQRYVKQVRNEYSEYYSDDLIDSGRSKFLINLLNKPIMQRLPSSCYDNIVNEIKQLKQNAN